ncbi:MAG: hypothetical protein Q8M03_11905 [Legionella sp.]|nr:hypothetical protein [Legionella sp.]
MIILYLPFAAHEIGDLLPRLQKWQENSRDNITIVKYQDNFDMTLLEEKNEIYICAHGNFIEGQFSLFNQVNKKGSNIDIPTLVERFEENFSPIIPKISTIHLYCCGHAEKNQSMAQQFQSMLIQPEYSEVCYYSGIIKEPDPDGKQWSLCDSGVFPIENVRQTLAPKEVAIEKPPSHASHDKPRLKSWHNPDENCNKLFAKRNAKIKAWREEKIAAFRKRETEIGNDGFPLAVKSPLPVIREKGRLQPDEFILMQNKIATCKKGDFGKEIEDEIMSIYTQSPG